MTEGSRQGRVNFLNYLFGGLTGDLYFEVTLIAPQGVTVSGKRILSRSYRLGQERPDWDRIDQLNAQGYGVYYGLTLKKRPTPATGRSSEANTALVTALWADVDLKDGHYASKDDAISGILRAVHIPAGALIDSGGGIHAVWNIEPVPVNEATIPALKTTLRGLAKAVNGDPAVADLARVFRLPDTVNTKPERNGARCEVIDILPHTTRLEDFAMYRALATPERPVLQREFARHKPDDLPQYVTWYLGTSHAQGNRNNALNWTAYKMHSDGYSEAEATSILLPRALQDGLDEKEALRTIHSAFAAPPGEPSRLNDNMKRRMMAGDVARRRYTQTTGGQI